MNEIQVFQIPKQPSYSDKIVELKVGQSVHFPFEKERSIRSMISGIKAKAAFIGRDYATRKITHLNAELLEVERIA